MDAILYGLLPVDSLGQVLQQELGLSKDETAMLSASFKNKVLAPVVDELRHYTPPTEQVRNDESSKAGQATPTEGVRVPSVMTTTQSTAQQINDVAQPHDRTLPELLLARAYEKKGGKALAAPTDSSAPAPEPSTPSEPGPEKPRYERADPYREPVSGQ